MRNQNIEKGRSGENYVRAKLEEAGIDAFRVSSVRKRGMPDFITAQGKYIDVKIAITRIDKKGWMFNCHHHGIKQNNIDYYVFIVAVSPLNIVPLILPARLINAKTFYVSQKMLSRGKYDSHKNNWNIINEKYTTKEDLKRLAKNKRKLDEIINNDLQKRLRAQNKNKPRMKSISVSFSATHRRALGYLAKKRGLHGDKSSTSALVRAALDMYLPTLGIVIENEQPNPVE